jgi:thiosulfate/3-mercaptopyruvate sulfurtransferase
VLISATDLAERVEAGQPTVLLDVRWKLGGPPGRESYLAGHLPGAVYVDLDTELAAPPTPLAGRHPLPDLAELQRAARRWGIRAATTVVVYDDDTNLAAARAWWLLRWASLLRVWLLDGGLAAWRRIGGPIDTDDVRPDAGDIELVGGAMPTLAADAAAACAREGVLLDARARPRYLGELEPIDPVAGHIPGARSAPTSENLTAEGTFAPAADLAHRFAATGVTAEQVCGVYCGSGVTAAHEIAALAIAGYPAALYPGSWSQWSNLPGREVATGPEPSTG